MSPHVINVIVGVSIPVLTGIIMWAFHRVARVRFANGHQKAALEKWRNDVREAVLQSQDFQIALRELQTIRNGVQGQSSELQIIRNGVQEQSTELHSLRNRVAELETNMGMRQQDISDVRTRLHGINLTLGRLQERFGHD